MGCQYYERLHAYHDGELAPAERAAVEAHVRDCTACAALLADLRGLTGLLARVPLGEAADLPMSRYYGAWHEAGHRGVLRLASALTGIAAALLLGSFLLRPEPVPQGVPVAASSWEVVSLMPPGAANADAEKGDELVQLAQWMANDLSTVEEPR